MADYYENELILKTNSFELTLHCLDLIMSSTNTKELKPTMAKLLPLPNFDDDEYSESKEETWGCPGDMEVFRYFVFEGLIYLDYRTWRYTNHKWITELCEKLGRWTASHDTEHKIELEYRYSIEYSDIMNVYRWSPEGDSFTKCKENLHHEFPRTFQEISK